MNEDVNFVIIEEGNALRLLLGSYDDGLPSIPNLLSAGIRNRIIVGADTEPQNKVDTEEWLSIKILKPLSLNLLRDI